MEDCHKGKLVTSGEAACGHESIAMGDGEDNRAARSSDCFWQLGIHPSSRPQDPEVLDEAMEPGFPKTIGGTADELGQRRALRFGPIHFQRDARLIDQMPVKDDLACAGRLRPDRRDDDHVDEIVV